MNDLRITITIELASVKIADALRDLALISKATWGYDKRFLEACIPALTIDPEWFSLERVFIAKVHGELAGVALLLPVNKCGVSELEQLFVHPDWQNAGVGTALMRFVCAKARGEGAKALMVVSDPHAQYFYEKHGAIQIGAEASDVNPHRQLPRLRLDLSAI